MTPVRFAIAAAAIWGSCGAAAALAQNQRSVADAVDAFSVDLTIRRQHVRADGSSLGSAPPSVTYHWEEVRSGAGWKTTMTLADADQPVVQTRRGPETLRDVSAVVRLERDEQGTVRLFDEKSRVIEPPSDATRQRLWELAGGSRQDVAPDFRAAPGSAGPSAGPSTQQDWLDAVLPALADAPRRRAALGARYDLSSRRVRGFDQYTATSGEGQVEVLADPNSALPVEINLVRNGALIEHTTMAYASAMGGRVLREHLHVERAAPGGSGARSVTDIQLANPYIGQGRDR
jgi:hypothetical protein